MNNSLLYPAGLEMKQSIAEIVVEMIVLFLLWVLSVLGNVSVCFVIYRSRRVQSTTNYFVVACAFADLIFSISTAPFYAGRIIANEWLAGEAMCRMVRFIQSAMPNITVFVLTSIGIDRYYTIIYPLSFKVTRDTAKRMIAFCVMASFVFCISRLFFYETLVIRNQHGKTAVVCPTFLDPRDEFGEIYPIVSVLIQYTTPLIIVTIIYLRLFRFIWRTGPLCMRFQRTANYVPRAKVKMVKMLMIMTSFTVGLLMPLNVVQLWVSIGKPVFVHPSVFIISMWLALCSTIAKPLIYLIFNSNFRRGCMEVFCMSTSKCYRSNTYAITTTSGFSKHNHVGVMKSSSQNRINSPRKAFDRSNHIDSSPWPLTNGISTTYL